MRCLYKGRDQLKKKLGKFPLVGRPPKNIFGCEEAALEVQMSLCVSIHQFTKLKFRGMDITSERNEMGTDTTSKRYAQGTDITSERNV